MRPTKPLSPTERKLRNLVRAYIFAGLAFMLLPGTFLGVWNLLSLSADHKHNALSAAWVQAHGHAQIFGWIGTFVIGIGFFSLSKMGEVHEDTVRRGWIAWCAWVLGVTGSWAAGVYGADWWVLLPCSAFFECCGYGTFFALVRQHKPKPPVDALPVVKENRQPWMKVVVLSSAAFAAALVWHLAMSIMVAYAGSGPEFPQWADRALLGVSAWGFLVLSVWGFNARWLSMFGGFQPPEGGRLLWAARITLVGVALGACGLMVLSSVSILAGCIVAVTSLKVFSNRLQRARGHAFVRSVRAAYAWLLVAATLGCWAAMLDQHSGLTGASRHALTVGFIGAMVFAIGQRLVPAFCGAASLFSPRFMIGSIVLLNIGCFLRVAAEIPAYEWGSTFAWRVLPLSAVIELTAVALFAINLLLSVLRAPAAQLQVQRAAA